jgi:hypothetical protein
MKAKEQDGGLQRRCEMLEKEINETIEWWKTMKWGLIDSTKEN